MKISPKNRQYALVGGWLATAAVAFAFGRMTGWLDTPTTPQQAATSKAGGAGSSGGGLLGSESGAAGARQDGQFATDHSGPAQTVGQITGGQPLEDWLKKLMAQEDDIYRMQNFMKLLDTLNSPEDIKAALKVIGSSRGGGRGPGGFFGGRMTEYGMLMEKFTQLDPKGAIAYAGEQQGPEKFMATASAVRTWTRLDPAAALSWAQTEGANLQMDFGRGGPGGGGQQPADGQPRENFALMGVVTQLAKTDLDKAISAASTAELGRMGGRMVETIAAEMISQRGDDAARKMVETLPEGEFRNEYIQQLAGRLANKDAAGTAQWALTLPAGDAKRRALGEAVQEWVGKDVAEAGKFMVSVPPGPDTDSARERLAGAAARTDASGAIKWAETITDQERKTRTIMSVTETALRTQPEVGKQILESASLSPEQKAQVAARATSDRGGRGGGGRGPGGGGAPGGGAPGGGGGGR